MARYSFDVGLSHSFLHAGFDPGAQWVLTMPFPLRFPLPFDGKLLGEVLRIFTDTVARWRRASAKREGWAGWRSVPSPEGERDRQVDRGLPDGDTGAVTAIQRASSDLRCNPHFHTVFLDGVYAPDRDDEGQIFHPAPPPSQLDIEQVVARAGKRILRFLQRRGVITVASADGDGEVNVVGDESAGEADPVQHSEENHPVLPGSCSRHGRRRLKQFR